MIIKLEIKTLKNKQKPSKNFSNNKNIYIETILLFIHGV